MLLTFIPNHMRRSSALRAATALLDGLTRFSSSLCKRGVASKRRSASLDASPLRWAWLSCSPEKVPCVPVGVVKRTAQCSLSINPPRADKRASTSLRAILSPCSSGDSSLTCSTASNSRASEVKFHVPCGKPMTRSLSSISPTALCAMWLATFTDSPWVGTARRNVPTAPLSEE